MVDADLQRIQHIAKYCGRIADTIKRYGHDYDIFLSDNDYFDSISMKIMQIGELAGALSDDFKDGTREQMQWGMIRGMRNLFAHSYAAMDKSIIWDVATRDIPGLLHFCMTLIRGEE